MGESFSIKSSHSNVECVENEMEGSSEQIVISTHKHIQREKKTEREE